MNMYLIQKFISIEFIKKQLLVSQRKISIFSRPFMNITRAINCQFYVIVIDPMIFLINQEKKQYALKLC